MSDLIDTKSSLKSPIKIYGFCTFCCKLINLIACDIDKVVNSYLVMRFLFRNEHNLTIKANIYEDILFLFGVFSKGISSIFLISYF